MRFMARGLIGLMLMVLTLALLAVAASSVFRAFEAQQSANNKPRQAQERVFAVNVEAVQQQDVTPFILTYGEIESGRTLEIRAAASGAIVSMSKNFRDGGIVKSGEELFRTDPSAAQASQALARTEVSEAKDELAEAQEALGLADDEVTAARNQLELRQNALERQRSLLERGVGTAAAIETAELAVSSANQAILGRRAALASAKARINSAKNSLARRQINLDEADRKLADTKVMAPFDGVLSGVNAVQGRLVNANEKLGDLIDPSALEVAFRVSNEEFGRLASSKDGIRNAKITVSPNTGDAKISGTIERINAAVGVGQSGREIFASINSASNIRPGDFVSVSVAEPKLNDVWVLPATAVSSDQHVLVLSEDDRLIEVDIKVERRQGANVIVSGQLRNKEVVLTRAPQLGSGIRVRPLRNGLPPKEPESIQISDELRQQMILFVKNNKRMPAERKAAILAQLNKPNIPPEVVKRITSRMGG